MKITITDQFNSEELEIKKMEDNLSIEIPKKITTADVTKILKLVIIYLNK